MMGRERCDEILRLIGETLATYDRVDVVAAAPHWGATPACMQLAAHRRESP